MQTDPIVLIYDHDHDQNANQEIDYSRAEESAGRSVYYSDSHTTVGRDTLTFLRTLPKVSGNDQGQAKASFKFTRDILVPSTLTSIEIKRPLIIEVSASIPVGATDAEILDIRERAIALLNDQTVMDKLHKQLMV